MLDTCLAHFYNSDLISSVHTNSYKPQCRKILLLSQTYMAMDVLSGLQGQYYLELLIIGIGISNA
jgi:hypothetical protein